MIVAALVQIGLGMLLGVLGVWGWRRAAEAAAEPDRPPEAFGDPGVLRRGAAACLVVGMLLLVAGFAGLLV